MILTTFTYTYTPASNPQKSIITTLAFPQNTTFTHYYIKQNTTNSASNNDNSTHNQEAQIPPIPSRSYHHALTFIFHHHKSFRILPLTGKTHYRTFITARFETSTLHLLHLFNKFTRSPSISTAAHNAIYTLFIQQHR